MKLSKSVLGTIGAAALTVSAAFASVPAQTSSCSYQFNTNLRLGAVSTDVQNLQKLLNMDAATRVAATGAGSSGFETLRFAGLTLTAVKKFQVANGITPVSGYVGPLTRGVLNTICSSTAPTTPTNTGNSGVSSNNIPVSVLVQGQANARLGEFVVSGNGVVTGIELMRTGLSNNATLRNVYLYDGATRITGASSVLTDGTIRFNSSAGLFSVSGSKTITVKADINSANASGQTVGVAMKSVTMMGGTPTTVVGVQGPLFSISSATLAGANLTTTSPSPSSTSVNAGSMNQTLWSNNVNIQTNRSRLHGVTFKMIGSAPANTLSNVQLYVDGVSAGYATVNSNMQYVFNMSGSPKELQTGSHLIELRADVVAGAYRNFYMSLEEATDLSIEDATLPGIFVTPTYLSSTLTNVNGGTITVNNGSLTINQDLAFNNTTTLVAGATNVKMAAFKFSAYGEDVKVTSLTFTPSFTSSTTLANVGLYVNGGQVSSSQTATHNTALTFSSLGTNLLVPAGGSVIVEIRGDVVNTVNNTPVTSGTVSFAIASGVAQGYTSSQTTTVSTASGQTLTISTNNATFAQTSGFGSVTRAPNSSQVKVGSYTIQTGSAEGITVNQITVGQSGTITTQLTNMTVKDASTGQTVGTPIGNPTTSNSFSTNVSVPINSTKTFDVYADLGSASTGQTVITTMAITYRGNTSNLTTTTSTVTGSTITSGVAQILAGGVTFSSGLSLPYQAVVPQSNFSIGTFNFKVNNSVGGAVLKDVTFTSATNTIGSITMNGKTASFVSGRATIFDVGSVVPADAGGINIPVTASLVCVGLAQGCSAISSSTVQVGISGITYNNGTTINTDLAPGTTTPISATSSMFALFASKPSLTVPSNINTGLNLAGENKIGEVTVAADAAGQIKVNRFVFATGSAGVTSASTTAARIADGSTTVAGSSCTYNTTTVTCVLGATPNGYAIAPGSSKTFSLYTTNSGTATASVSVVALSSSITTAGFLWDDVVGGGTDITGASIYNFPTNSYTIRQ